ncbi:hypothetical protein LP419_15535 [Massilia sp. H-1]|nr:hypothetical protein LP419_15535 [Massilia sp. H-1]
MAGKHQRDHVPAGEHGALAVEMADIAAVDEYVDEAPDLAVGRQQMSAQAREALTERAERLGHAGRFDGNLGAAVGKTAQRAGKLDLNRHAGLTPLDG